MFVDVCSAVFLFAASILRYSGLLDYKLTQNMLYLETSIMLGMGGGTRKRGRPRARWLDDIKAITNSTLAELCDSARDRDAWKKMIMAITRSRTRLDGTR